jgi:hypothetical protein
MRRSWARCSWCEHSKTRVLYLDCHRSDSVAAIVGRSFRFRVKHASSRHHRLQICDVETVWNRLSTAESFESLDVAVAGTKKLSITADDQIAELYLDGVVASVAPGDWTKVRFIDIRSDTKVIAVKAVDLAQVSEPNRMNRLKLEGREVQMSCSIQACSFSCCFSISRS